MTAATIFVGIAGFLVGNILFVGVMRWVATVHEILKDPTRAGSHGKAGRVLLASLLGSGPWLIALAIGGGIAIRGEPWAIPLFVGAAISIVAMGSMTFMFLNRFKRTRIVEQSGREGTQG